MTREGAVRKAIEYCRSTIMEVGPIVDVSYYDLAYLDEKALNCPADMLETYHSVRSAFRNQWVVSFKRNEAPGRVTCPETSDVCVFENGEVTPL